MAESCGSEGDNRLSLIRAQRGRLRFVLHLLVLVLAVPGLGRLTASADTRVFFGDNVYHRDLIEFEASFRQNNNILLLLRYRDEPITASPEFARILREATDEAWRLPRVLRVESLATFPHVTAEVGAFVVEPVLDVICPDACRPDQAGLVNDPLLRARLVSTDATTVGLYLTFDLPYESPSAVQAITDAVRDLAQRLTDAHEGITAHFVGGITMMDAFNEAAERDSATLVPLVLLVMLGVLVITLGEPRLVALLLGTGVYAVLVAMGIAGWFGLILNAATSITPVIILTLTIASGLHVMLTFQRQLSGETPDIPQAARMALDLNRGPVLLATLTTVMGFLSMNLADSPPIRELGNLVSVGLVAGASVLLFMVPDGLARLRRVNTTRASRGLRTLLERAMRGDPRRRMLVSSVVVLVCVAGLARLGINDDFVEYFDSSFEFRRAAEFSQAHMSGPNYIDLAVASGAPDGIYDPAYLAVVRDLSAWLRERDLVASVASISDVVEDVAQSFDPTADFTRFTTEQIAQYVLLYELSLTAGQDLDDFFDKSRSSSRISVLLSGGNSMTVVALEEAIKDWFAERAPPRYRITVTGINIPVAHMSLLNIQSMLRGILASLVLIALTVGVYFRDVRVFLVTGPAIVLPIAMGFGVWGWLVGDIGLAASVIAAMTVGIIVDDAIHIVYRYKHTQRILGVPPDEAVDVTVMTVGHAVLVTSLALAAGFSFLAFSGFEVNRALGLCATLIVASGLVVHLMLVPGVLAWLDRTRRTVYDSRTSSG